jgi:hypothetical protein
MESQDPNNFSTKQAPFPTNYKNNPLSIIQAIFTTIKKIYSPREDKIIL